MGYMNDTDRWLDAQLTAFSKGAIEFDEMKRNIREKILESYRNGCKAGAGHVREYRGTGAEGAQSPAPPRGGRGNRRG